MRRSHLLAACLCCLMSSGMAHAVPDEKTPDYEQIGRFIYGFHRAGASIDTLRDPELARNGPPTLAARAHALAEKYDAVIKADGRATDAEAQAILREASEVGAAVDAWRRSRGR